jgi:hypothetical protein
MSQLLIELPIQASAIDEIRPAIDDALRGEFPGGMLQRRWEGDTLVLWGPGAKGTITLEDGKLVGRADLAPPASLMRPLIEQKIGAALRRVVAGR